MTYRPKTLSRGITPIGITLREVRFQEFSGAVIGLFQFPVTGRTRRGTTVPDDFRGQPVLIQRIEAGAAARRMISVTQWTGDPSIDRCDWLAVCQATRRRLKLFSLSLPSEHKILSAAGIGALAPQNAAATAPDRPKKRRSPENIVR